MTAIICLIGCQSDSVKPRVTPSATSRQLQLAELGYSTFASGNYTEAASLFERSLQIAYLHDNAEMIASLAYHLAASYARLRQYKSALLWIAESRQAATGTRNPRLAELDLIEAKVMLRAGKIEQADALIDRALKRVPAPAGSIRARFLILSADLAILKNDLDAATRSLQEVTRIQSAAHTAAYMMTSGRLAMSTSRWAQAADHFDNAARLFQKTMQYDAMVTALASAGRAYRESKKPASAANRLFRAGRSARMQENFQDAKAYLQEALAAASAAKQTSMVELIQNWLTQSTSGADSSSLTP